MYFSNTLSDHSARLQFLITRRKIHAGRFSSGAHPTNTMRAPCVCRSCPGIWRGFLGKFQKRGKNREGSKLPEIGGNADKKIYQCRNSGNIQRFQQIEENNRSCPMMPTAEQTHNHKFHICFLKSIFGNVLFWGNSKKSPRCVARWLIQHML